MSIFRWKPISLAVAWTLFILFLFSIPANQLPSGRIWAYDKIGHMGLFFVLAALWMRVFSARSRKMILLFLLCGVAFAPLTELYQSVLSLGRRMDMMDSLADAAGFGLGIAFWILWEKFRPEPREQL